MNSNEMQSATVGGNLITEMGFKLRLVSTLV
jgi:hypothetical protein